MMTNRLLPLVFSLSFIFSLFSFTGCGDSEIEGCTNEFATNFDASATVDCCCEFEVQALVDDLIGAYDYKVKNSDFTVGYSIQTVTITRDAEDDSRFYINDYFILDIRSSFENGVFKLISDSREVLGCTSRTTGTLRKENGTLLADFKYISSGTPIPPKQSPCEIGNFSSEGELTKR